jgi:hypothetical protein
VKIRYEIEIDVYDRALFIAKHRTLGVLEQRLSDSLRWLDGVDVTFVKQTVDDETEVACDCAASGTDAR